MSTSFAPVTDGSTAGSADPALEWALSRLVEDGVISATQASAVRLARQAATTSAVGGEPAQAVAPAVPRHTVMPEVLGYIGAALVGSALLTLVSQSWEGWTATTRLMVVGTAAAVAGVAGLVVAAASGWRAGLAVGPAFRRRLAATALSVGSVLAGVTTLVGCDALGRGEAPWTSLVSGAVAFVAAAGTAWLVRSPLTTLAVAAATAWLVLGAVVAWQPPASAWYLPVLTTVAAAAWVAVAPRLLAVPALSEALGWAFALQFLVPFALYAGLAGPETGLATAWDEGLQQAWVARGILALLAVAGIVVFVRGGRWPWAAGGVLAAVSATLAVGGQTLNLAMALLQAGLALLLVSAFLVGVRRRRGHRGDPTRPGQA